MNLALYLDVSLMALSFVPLSAQAQMAQNKPGLTQPNLINRTVVRQDSAFLFVGEENTIEIVGYKKGTWKLLAKHASIHVFDSPWRYTVILDTWRPDTLELVGNGKILLTKTFYPIYDQDPRARLGNIMGDSATVAEIIANKRLVIFIPGSNISGFHIFDFTLRLTTGQLPDWKKELPVQGAALTPESNDRIRQLRRGDKVTFAEIRMVGRSDRVRTLPPYSIYIK